MAYLFQRGNRYYLKYYVGGRQKEIGLRTDSLQLAKEKMRQFESGLERGIENPFPTHTPIAQVLTAYVDHIRATKSPKSAQNDIYYLREMFGPICDAVKITSRTVTRRGRRLKTSPDDRGRIIIPPIEANCFEAITPGQVAAFIETKIRRQGIVPKTCNHYRSILRRVFNWSMKQYGLKIPDRINPAAEVESYREKDRTIRYLTLPQIDEQMHALRFNPQLQTMVALLIYAGVRRGELLWLTIDDIDLPPAASGKLPGAGMIRIRPKIYNGYEWTPKTGRARVVPISSTLRGWLDAYAPRPSDGPGRGWYFPSPDGKRWEEDNFSADLRAANGENGLIWACLDYRHTFGTHLAHNGLSLYKISRLMGNSPDICRKHYAGVIAEDLSDDVDFVLSKHHVANTKSAQ